MIPGGDVSLVDSGTLKANKYSIPKSPFNMVYVTIVLSNEISFIAGYAIAGKMLFRMAVDSKRYYPIWGTCLGRLGYKIKFFDV